MSTELENLVRIGTLKVEAPATAELAGLRRSGEARLADAANASLSLESRFDLAYNAAHALALAALRHAGYRSDNRYAVFQLVPHTLGLSQTTCVFWRSVTEFGTRPSTRDCWRLMIRSSMR